MFRCIRASFLLILLAVPPLKTAESLSLRHGRRETADVDADANAPIKEYVCTTRYAVEAKTMAPAAIVGGMGNLGGLAGQLGAKAPIKKAGLKGLDTVMAPEEGSRNCGSACAGLAGDGGAVVGTLKITVAAALTPDADVAVEEAIASHLGVCRCDVTARPKCVPVTFTTTTTTTTTTTLLIECTKHKMVIDYEFRLCHGGPAKWEMSRVTNLMANADHISEKFKELTLFATRLKLLATASGPTVENRRCEFLNGGGTTHLGCGEDGVEHIVTGSYEMDWNEKVNKKELEEIKTSVESNFAFYSGLSDCPQKVDVKLKGPPEVYRCSADEFYGSPPSQVKTPNCYAGCPAYTLKR